MKADKNRATLRVSQSRAIVEGRVVVALPRLNYAETLLFKRRARLKGKAQDKFTLTRTADAARTRIGPSMCWVQYDDVERWVGYRSGRRLLQQRTTWRSGGEISARREEADGSKDEYGRPGRKAHARQNTKFVGCP